MDISDIEALVQLIIYDPCTGTIRNIALPLRPDILTVSRGNPDTKKRDSQIHWLCKTSANRHNVDGGI